jgi:hypothetical protein
MMGGCDSGSSTPKWYLDADRDGFGNPNSLIKSKEQPVGYVADNTDCDDSAGRTNPDANELCGDNIDNDCDKSIDENCFNKWFFDADIDGYGDPDDSINAETQPKGYVSNSLDCDDTNQSINPGATEIRGDGIDQNCDGADLSDISDPNDVDNDGDGQTENQGDCNDNDANIFKGAVEICNDGKDNDCDGKTDCNDSDCSSSSYCKSCSDRDDDGYYAESDCGTSIDCNDYDSNIKPGATEICNDGKDNDCDGDVDEGCTSPFLMDNLIGTWHGQLDTDESSLDLTMIINTDYSVSLLENSNFNGSALIGSNGKIEVSYATKQTSGENELGTMYGNMSPDKRKITFNRIVWNDSGGESDDESVLGTFIKSDQ